MNILVNCISEALDVDSVSLPEDLNYTLHPNWDSMAQLSLIVKIEEEYGKVVDGGVFKKYFTIKSLSEYLAN